MPRLVNRTPKYRKHASGQAMVTLSGRDCYLGKHGTAASRREYGRVTAEWKSNNRSLPAHVVGDDYTIGDLLLAYWAHCIETSPVPGKLTGDMRSLKMALRIVKALYVDRDLRDFGPLALHTVRDQMVKDHDWSRDYINKQVTRIRGMFKWGISREIVDATTWAALKLMEPLRIGKTKARENAPVTTIDDVYVDAVIPWFSRHVRAMVQLQRLTGMRPGELVLLRWVDIVTKNPQLWEFRPRKHKNLHRGQERVIYLNAEAQELMEPFRTTSLADYVFSPRRAEDERRELKTKNRMTPPTYGNGPGTNRTRKPRREPGEHYGVDSYRRAITRACDLANSWAKGGVIIANDERAIPRWHPHQIRHNTATKLRAEHGLEAAQVILGHKTLTATQIYAEKNVEKAKRIMTGGK